MLGFIAFCVWCCNKGSAFQKVVRPYDSDLRTGVGAPYNSYGPPAGGELLHLVEDVHMHLFIAMVLYFVFMIAAVRYVEKSIAVWQEYEKQLRQLGYPAKVEGEMTSLLSRLVTGRMISLYSYHAVRQYFIYWMQARQVKMSQKKGLSGKGSGLSGFGKDFDFATYLIVHVDEIMDDMLTIHDTTWAFVASVFGIMGLIARFCFENKGDSVDKTAYIIGSVVVVVEFLILLRVEFQYKRDIKRSEGRSMSEAQRFDTDWAGDDLDGKESKAEDGAQRSPPAVVDNLREVHSFAHSAELVLLRVLQAILLYSCFFCARFIGSPNVYLMATYEYTKIYGMAQWLKAIVIFLVIFCTYCILPLLISSLNLMLRLPPFVDKAEIGVVKAICEEQPNYMETRYGLRDGKEISVSTASGSKPNQVQPVGPPAEPLIEAEEILG